MATPRWITAAEAIADDLGDVKGPDSAADGNLALFDGTTGKLLKAGAPTEATIDSTTNVLIGDGAGNAIDSTKSIAELGGNPPFTLNSGDVLAQDDELNPLIDYGDDGARSTDWIPHKEDLTGYWSVRSNTPIAGTIDNVSVSEGGDITLLCLDGQEPHPTGGALQINTGYAFDDGAATPADGGNLSIILGGGVNGGANGYCYIRSVIALNPIDDAPTPAVEGMIYADTDHHLYYYNGTTWKQLDNA